MVKEIVWNRETDMEEIIDHRTPFKSLYFLTVSKFLLGLRPKCLENQVTKCLLADSRTCRAIEGHVLLYQMSNYQGGIFVDSRYSLKKARKDIWGYSIGGKFTVCLNSWAAQVDILTQCITPLAPI
jgi:hypothetical protein